MRIEQWMPTAIPNYSQWYVNCAQVNIIGPGGGIPTEFAHFPGTYDINHPGKQALIFPNKIKKLILSSIGLQIPMNQWVNGGLPEDQMRLLEYSPPGPAVWTG
jgi:hypothetical protein